MLRAHDEFTDPADRNLFVGIRIDETDIEEVDRL
jgi:hypothetical protein